jgi:hypothetical protein
MTSAGTTLTRTLHDCGCVSASEAPRDDGELVVVAVTVPDPCGHCSPSICYPAPNRAPIHAPLLWGRIATAHQGYQVLPVGSANR